VVGCGCSGSATDRIRVPSSHRETENTTASNATEVKMPFLVITIPSSVIRTSATCRRAGVYDSAVRILSWAQLFDLSFADHNAQLLVFVRPPTSSTSHKQSTMLGDSYNQADMSALACYDCFASILLLPYQQDTERPRARHNNVSILLRKAPHSSLLTRVHPNLSTSNILPSEASGVQLVKLPACI
jgi:hypothetical protein